MDDTTLAASIATRIRKVRAEQSISQEQLALAAGLSRAYMGSIERGERKLSVVSIARIAVALQVEVGALFPSLDVLSGHVSSETLSRDLEAIQQSRNRRQRRRKRKEQRGRATQIEDTADEVESISSAKYSDRDSEGYEGKGRVNTGEKQALLTTGAAAERLGVSSRTLERWAKSGKVPSILLSDKAGKAYRVFNSDEITKEELHQHRRKV